MKTCADCKVPKDESEFGWKNKEKGWRRSYCNECMKAHRLKHYYGNKQQYLDRNARRREEVLRKYLEWLASHPCVDCGEDDVLVLDSDHVRGKKRGCISKMVNSYTWSTVLRELKKCESRCANCHRRKTATEQGWAKYVPDGTVAQMVRAHA